LLRITCYHRFYVKFAWMRHSYWALPRQNHFETIEFHSCCAQPMNLIHHLFCIINAAYCKVSPHFVWWEKKKTYAIRPMANDHGSIDASQDALSQEFQFHYQSTQSLPGTSETFPPLLPLKQLWMQLCRNWFTLAQAVFVSWKEKQIESMKDHPLA
jgi:hypothetical protein